MLCGNQVTSSLEVNYYKLQTVCARISDIWILQLPIMYYSSAIASINLERLEPLK